MQHKDYTGINLSLSIYAAFLLCCFLVVSSIKACAFELNKLVTPVGERYVLWIRINRSCPLLPLQVASVRSEV